MVNIIENPDAPGDTTTTYTINPGNPGDIVFGEIPTVDDIDWYNVSFEGKAGYTYWVTAKQDGSLGGLEYLKVALLDSRTNIIDSDSDQTLAAFTVDPVTSGDFFISVESGDSFFADPVGTYTLDVLREVADNQYTQAKVKVDGRAYKGNLDYSWGGFGSDVDWVGVKLEKGQTYFFDQTALDGYTGLGQLYLVDRNGQELKRSGSGDSFVYTADANQTYYLKVTGYNRPGQFKVQVDSDVSGSASTKESLSVGESFRGDFYDNGGHIDYDWYRVELKAGVKYQIDLLGSSFTTYLKLHNKDGSTVTDWGHSSNNQDLSVNEFSVSSRGIYYISAGGFSSNYKISFGISGERYGNDGNNTIYGGPSDNIIRGKGGDDRIYGQNGNDTLDGQAGDDQLHGGKGNDNLLGGRGSDTLNGDGGIDVLKGGKGKDMLDGGDGNDRMTGGDGADTFKFSGGQDKITDFNAVSNHEKIDLTGVSSIAGMKDLRVNHTTQDGSDLVIDDGAGNTLTLLGLTIDDLGKADFIF